MNEETLFSAYRNAEHIDPVIAEAQQEDKLEHMGVVKCRVPSCMTTIAMYTGRVICRYHHGKMLRGEK